MARILITGGTGSLGSDLVARLGQTSHTVRVTSRQPKPKDAKLEWTQVNFETQTDFSEALRDVDVVVHCASSSMKNTYQTDVIGTQNFLAAVKKSQVKNFIFISIVGIDHVPYSYYQYKLETEKNIQASGVSYTITRISQFHGFIDLLLGLTHKLPVMPLPTRWQLQTIDTREVANYLMPFIEAPATRQIDNVAGPQVMRLGDMAAQWRDAQGSHKPIIRVPMFGAMTRAVGEGRLTAPDKAYGSITWADYLQEKYARAAQVAAAAR